MTKDEKNLIELVDGFSIDMRNTLIEKSENGKTGWNDSEMMDTLIINLKNKVDNVRKEDHDRDDKMVDIANLAAFIWNIM